MRSRRFHTKLLWCIGGITGVSLATVGVLLAVTAYARSQALMQSRLQTQSKMIAESVAAAVAFEDAKTAGELLRSASADENIQGVFVYKEDGKSGAFAEYRREGWTHQAPLSLAQSDAGWWGTSSISIESPVRAGGEISGRVVLVCDLLPLRRELRNQAIVAGLTVLAALVTALAVAAKTGQALLGPIIRLSGAARKVSDEGTYSVRVEKTSDDEVGVLTDAFNGMLSRIEEQDAALRRSNDQLEHRVESRTHELAQRTAELEKSMVAAEAANRAKSDFLANMSHEIRTPMTAILGFADLLLDASQSPQQRDEHVHTMRRNGEHLMSIINDILDISKIEAGHMTVESISTSPMRIVDEVTEMMRGRAGAKGLTLTVEHAFPIPLTIKSDPVRLRQILVNIIGNAIKFTQRGGVFVRIGADAAAKKVTIGVRDTGIGLSAEQLDRLFRPFTQADNTMARRFGGTGLGLAISKRLAEILGGDVTVQSEPGVGTAFTVVLSADADAFANMASEAESATGAALPAAHAASAQGKPGVRVLLVEDGLDNQRLIAFHLRKAGALVEIADNGRIAIEMVDAAIAAGAAYEVIFMDMQMPEMDGYSAATALRKKGFVTPIIALTAHAMAGDRAKCLASGCDDYLTKPVNRDAMVSAMHTWRGRPSDAGTIAA